MIRYARLPDLAAITEIYNQAIDAGFQTAYTERLRAEDRVRWFDEHTPGAYPLIVYEDNDEVTGWLSISPYRADRAALRFAVEVSYFIHTDHRRKGIGYRLMQRGLEACRQLGYRTILAIILEPNTASALLLEKCGFEKWAYLPAVADFNGIECSQVYYGLKMNADHSHATNTISPTES